MVSVKEPNRKDKDLLVLEYSNEPLPSVPCHGGADTSVFILGWFVSVDLTTSLVAKNLASWFRLPPW